MYSAILNLDDPSTAGIDYQTMNTIVVADQFSADNNYTRREDRHGGAQRGVPLLRQRSGRNAGVQGRPRRSLPRAGAGQVRFLRFHPYGVNFDPNSSLDCYSPPVPDEHACNPLSRTRQPAASRASGR